MERHVTTLHLETFPEATKPEIPPPTPTDITKLVENLQTDELRSIAWWRFGERRDARRAATWTAPGLAAERDRAAAAEHARTVVAANETWQSLVANDPDTVLAELEAAFEDNESPAIAVNCEDATVHLAVLFPAISLIPERKTAITPGGKPTLKPRTKTERNHLYVVALGSTALATVKEAFAVAPSLIAAELVALRRTPESTVEIIYTGRFTRDRLEHLDWSRIDPVAELLAADGAALIRAGSSGAVSGFADPTPQLQDLVTAVQRALASPPTPPETG